MTRIAECLIDEYLGEVVRVRPAIKGFVKKSIAKYKHFRARWITADTWAVSFSSQEEVERYVTDLNSALVNKYGVKAKFKVGKEHFPTLHRISRKKRRMGKTVLIHPEPTKSDRPFIELEVVFGDDASA